MKPWINCWLLSLLLLGCTIIEWTVATNPRSSALAFQAFLPCIQQRPSSLQQGLQPVRVRPSSLQPLHAIKKISSVLKRKDPPAKKKYSSEYLLSLQESYGETSRPYRRNYFTSDDWLVYRRSDRFVKVLSNIWKSGIAQQLLKEVILIASASLLVVLWNVLLVEGYDDFQFIHHLPIFSTTTFPLLRLPMEPFTLSSPALALLLVFRTNSSYSRWNEARKAWGSVINASRTILRLASVWTDTGYSAQVQRVADCVWAFARSLQRRLLSATEDQQAYEEDLRRYLDPDFAEALISARHSPTKALRELTVAIQALDLDPIRQSQVESAVSVLCDDLGACERIFTSPVPLFYARHTERFIAGWLLFLPLALYSSFTHSWNHWGVVPASVTLAFFLFGIEEIAVQLEEPFSILPLQIMVDGIRQSVDDHVSWYCSDNPEQPNGAMDDEDDVSNNQHQKASSNKAVENGIQLEMNINGREETGRMTRPSHYHDRINQEMNLDHQNGQERSGPGPSREVTISSHNPGSWMLPNGNSTSLPTSTFQS